jgi:hypothetical protein
MGTASEWVPSATPPHFGKAVAAEEAKLLVESRVLQK